MTNIPPRQEEAPINYDDEVNLLDLVESLLDRKWLILSGTFICALSVALYTFFTPRQYKSEALILVSPSIVQPSSKDEEGTRVSEITVSSLEASTYEVLAKSDELMLALADTLRSTLPPEILGEISASGEQHTLVRELMENLEVTLLQDDDKRAPSSTPLLMLQYKSSEASLPPLVVNYWSELFLQRNQGLSSNITDDFYKSVVQQYEQAKRNLEQKEDQLSKLNASSNELNRIKTEMSFKSSQLDTALNAYQRVQTELAQKEQEFIYIKEVLIEIEEDNEWIGYKNVNEIPIRPNMPARKNLFEVMNDIDILSQDSVLVDVGLKQEENRITAKHQSMRLSFERETGLSLKRLKSAHNDTLIVDYSSQLTLSDRDIHRLEIKKRTLQNTLEKQEKFWVTRKAIIDDSLWDQVYSDKKIDVDLQKELRNHGLISEEVNIVYVGLTDSLAHCENVLSRLKETKKFLHSEISRLQEEAIELFVEIDSLETLERRLNDIIEKEKNDFRNKTIRLTEGKLVQLQLKRQSFNDYKIQYSSVKSREEALMREINELRSQFNYYEQTYATWRDQLSSIAIQVDSLDLERRRIERDVSVYQESFNRFSRLQEEARIAREQAAGDIQIVSRGYISQPQSRGTVKKALIATIISLMALSMFVLISKSLRK